MKRDPHEVLGVAPGANLEEIRSAYRSLARRYHPDASGRPETAEEFHRITAAYRELTEGVCGCEAQSVRVQVRVASGGWREEPGPEPRRGARAEPWPSTGRAARSAAGSRSEAEPLISPRSRRGRAPEAEPLVSSRTRGGSPSALRAGDRWSELDLLLWLLRPGRF